MFREVWRLVIIVAVAQVFLRLFNPMQRRREVDIRVECNGAIPDHQERLCEG